MLSVRRTGHGGFVSGRLKVAMVAMLFGMFKVLRNDLLGCSTFEKIDDVVRDRRAMCSIKYSTMREWRLHVKLISCDDDLIETAIP